MAIAVVAVVAGSLLDAVGLAGDVALLDTDFELAPLLAEVAVLVAALYAARKLRFPLLLLAAVIARAVLVLDTVAGVFGTGNWLAWAALLLGLGELGDHGDAAGRPQPVGVLEARRRGAADRRSDGLCCSTGATSAGS